MPMEAMTINTADQPTVPALRKEEDEAMKIARIKVRPERIAAVDRGAIETAGRK